MWRKVGVLDAIQGHFVAYWAVTVARRDQAQADRSGPGPQLSSRQEPPADMGHIEGALAPPYVETVSRAGLLPPPAADTGLRHWDFPALRGRPLAFLLAYIKAH